MIIPAGGSPLPDTCAGLVGSHDSAVGSTAHPAPRPPGHLDHLDLFGDDFVRAPYPWLELLRTAAPVHHDSGTGLWLVSRHRDVRQVLLDPAVFRPDNAQDAVTPLPVAALRSLARAGFALPPALANNSTDSHAGLRQVVTRFFSPRRVAAFVPVMERIADELLLSVRGRLDTDGTCDVFASFAQLLPCRVLMELLGIEGVAPATLIRWSDASLELFWGNPSSRRQAELAALVGEFYTWLSATVEAGTAAPDSLIGTLARHRLPDGERLDTKVAVSVCFFVLIAGQSTTGQLITTVLRGALTEPGLWQRVAHEAGLAEGWVEETLRREPPVTTWRRVTAQPVRLGGAELPAGARLLLMLMGTGSDPEVFDEPEKMCPHRPNARRHLAFGVGDHRCPGASLARTEAVVALRAAARVLPHVQLADSSTEPPMLGLLSFRAPLHLAVTG
ncbi:cytochrome P450 [Streptomyces sp. NPDC058001]|uniref:cytochrome P450 n=1 Tax=Streptomyces sp. NPDC058001 TaxID=3346300 RepID=UPI0036E3EC0B